MNITEYIRTEAVNSLFDMQCFEKSFLTWKPLIEKQIGQSPDYYSILNLGDSLRNIFQATGTAGREQSTLSASGSCWEGLVCWYLNLCLLGSRAVVIKHSKKLMPSCIADAITVNYGTFVSNTESDLIAITFPNFNDYLQPIETLSPDGKFDYRSTVEKLTKRDFNKLEVGIIQCKTNWNDNAQIPMLWEIVYSSTGFENNIAIGRNCYKMKDFKKFFYTFVTVPSNKNVKYKPGGLPVQRVCNLSGGNYWGQPTGSGVAESLKEIYKKNFTNSWITGTQKNDLELQLKNKAANVYLRVAL